MANDDVIHLFDELSQGRITRRQLLQALGIAVVAGPVSAYAQGRCADQGRSDAPGCDRTPAPPPFEPTGWKTVYMDHFIVRAADYKREAAYFAALMNWRIRSDDGSKAVLDIGDDVGSVIIHGGYEPPPAPPAQPVSDSAAARGGGGRGGRGGGARAPARTVWEGFCWGIEPWDARKVEAELRKRGLNPVADNAGKDFQSFHVVDPGGFDLQISNSNRGNRPRRSGGSSVAHAAPFESTTWKTVWLDHISFQCPNYKESTAFYQALLGWTPMGDEGSQNETQIGELGNIIIRGGGGGRGCAGRAGGDSTGGRGGAAAAAARKAIINHCAFGITPWDADAVKAELTKRGLNAREDTGGKGDIHTAPYQSYHTTTPDGFDLQISNATKERRQVR